MSSPEEPVGHRSPLVEAIGQCIDPYGVSVDGLPADAARMLEIAPPVLPNVSRLAAAYAYLTRWTVYLPEDAPESYTPLGDVDAGALEDILFELYDARAQETCQPLEYTLPEVYEKATCESILAAMHPEIYADDNGTPPEPDRSFDCTQCESTVFFDAQAIPRISGQCAITMANQKKPL